MFFKSILLTVLPALAIAANDWTKPCTSGTCSYESGDGKNTAWSNLVINAASTDVLSDITSAAGWEILNCDEKSTDPQDIRLVCVDQTKGCSHLFNNGAENTIVRLPESCAGGPFARVVRSWVDEDQTLPARLAKRGQTSGEVRGLALDFDFSKIPESKGKVYITVAATNSPAQRDAIRPAAVKRSLQPIRHANRRAQATAVIRDFTSAPIKRSPFSIGGAFKKIGSSLSSGLDKAKETLKAVPKKIKEVVNKAKQGAKKVVDKAKQGAKKVADKVKQGAKEVVDKAKSVGKSIAKEGQKVVDKAADLASDAKDEVSDFLGDVGDAVSDGVDKAADATEDFFGEAGNLISSGAEAIGDFVESVRDATDFDETFSKDFDLININKNFPILDQSISCPQQGNVPGFEAGLKIDVDVAAKLTANVGFIVTGSIVPPNIDKLAFTGGLSGDVSATFNVDANAKGTFETPDLKLFEVGLPGLNFPGIVSVGPSFSVNAKANAELGVVADISVGASIALPEVQFTFPPSEGGSSAKVNPKDAPVKLDVGASASLTGRAEAHLIPRLDIGVTFLSGAAKATVFANVDASTGLDFTLNAKVEGAPVDGTVGNPNIDFKNFDSSFGGSVGMDVGVSINVGAEAALEPFFDQSANFEVFQKTFPLFEKKFGDQARKRSVLALDDGRLSKRALVCPGAGEGSPQNGVVDAVAQGTA